MAPRRASGGGHSETPAGEPNPEEEAKRPKLDVTSLKVAELKAELSKRGLDTKGLKGDLATRLSEALSKESGESGPVLADENIMAVSEAPKEKEAESDKMQLDQPAPSSEPAAPEPTPAVTPTPAAAPSSELTSKEDRMDVDAAPATPAVAQAKKAPGPGKGKKFDKKPGDKKTGNKPKHVDKNKPAGPSGLTVSDILGDELTKLSLEYWAGPQKKPYSAEIVDRVYKTELAGSNFSLARIMLLELSHYLEGYLWPNFDQNSSLPHVISILVMINEKFRDNVPAWEAFEKAPQQVGLFFSRVFSLLDLTFKERTQYVNFLVNAFQSLENSLIREHVAKVVSMKCWVACTPARVAAELERMPDLKRHWNRAKKSDDADAKSFMSNLIKSSLTYVEQVKNGKDQDVIRYCERFAELMQDLLNQLPTRRFFLLLFSDHHVLPRCMRSLLYKTPRVGALFGDMIRSVLFYYHFEINNFTGEALSDNEITDLHTRKIQALQRLAFQKYPELKKFYLSNVGAVDSRKSLSSHIGVLSQERLEDLVIDIGLFRPEERGKHQSDFLLDCLLLEYEKRQSQLDRINESSLYPTESILWDEQHVPSKNYNGETVLALPKLNLQFLTFHDYLLRNFKLFSLEATYEIRQDVEDAVRRCNPRKGSPSSPNGTTFKGWSRYALEPSSFVIKEVGQPALGQQKPASVIGELVLNLSKIQAPHIRKEWEELHRFDVLFLLEIVATVPSNGERDESLPFAEAYGLSAIRGCEILEVFDESGKLIREVEDSNRPQVTGDTRKYRVKLDSAQYKIDQDNDDSVIYERINLVLRRKPKENNFKAVLETMRDLMNAQCVLPDWLNDIFLGYGNPGEIAPVSPLPQLNFVDTFLDVDHLKASYPSKAVKIEGAVTAGCGFVLKQDDSNEIVAVPYSRQGKRNQVPFTPRQIEAIESGVRPGLTLVVGPPGTGKTDVAVQTISNLYHNFPHEKILIITHSNQALNQIFEKIAGLDIDERHLLRLGHGHGMLGTKQNFGKAGRVDFMLALRLERLADFERLAQAVLGSSGQASYTCETATIAFRAQILPAWRRFLERAKESDEETFVLQNFPFSGYWADAENLFKGNKQADLATAQTLWAQLRSLQTQLEESRAFELLKSGHDRSNYLLSRQSRIVAMTCTHAALKRQDLVDSGFTYDSIVMEEAAQVLEIETFIPMLLQANEGGTSRLKRVMLIGDHHQLPPVIKNPAFQKYAHLDQSLFARFVRLGVRTVDLDAQGRARPTLAKLYNWRYSSLGDLPVTHSPQFNLANAGFAHECQVINVEDYEGQGETEPTPHFIQNLGEAEYVVAVFMYMRLIGYPAEKISILTTYNGQKNLIRDVIDRRCAWNPIFGRPAKISTVDRFQGQQNDFVLLSLVRTKTVGHLRDVRRLVVAMSRARLGLYIFCRQNLFANCYELTPTFSQFLGKPNKLQLVRETHPTARQAGQPVPSFEVQDVIHMGNIVAESDPSRRK